MLILSVVVYLENHDLDEFTRPDGARFHKWLPNGRDDAVVVPVTDARNSLELWFERRGYVQDAFIRYDPGRFEVDTDVMRRQGYLDSGVLFAEARFAHATASELTAVRNNARDSDDYVSVGKRVVQFLQPPLSAFLDLLKTQYGQYWIRDLQPWDSRRESLGSYCSNLELRWRETPNDPWRDFRPTELIVNFVASAALPERLAEYVTEADWRTIQSSFDPASEQPLASRQFVRAQELMDGGHLAEAVIQAVTGSELAIEYFARSRGV